MPFQRMPPSTDRLSPRTMQNSVFPFWGKSSGVAIISPWGPASGRYLSCRGLGKASGDPWSGCPGRFYKTICASDTQRNPM